MIEGSEVELADSCKYLATVLDYELNFQANFEAIHKERLYFLRKINALCPVGLLCAQKGTSSTRLSLPLPLQGTCASIFR